MVGGFLIGLLTSIDNPFFSKIEDFGVRLMVTAGITAIIWIAVMFLTPPESDETLHQFYRKVRPGGPGWRRQQAQTGLNPLQDLGKDIQRVLAAVLLLFGSMFTVGGFLLLQSATGFISLIAAVAGGFWLRQLNKSMAPPMARPGTSEV
jgi:hypothetical protein